MAVREAAIVLSAVDASRKSEPMSTDIDAGEDLAASMSDASLRRTPYSPLPPCGSGGPALLTSPDREDSSPLLGIRRRHHRLPLAPRLLLVGGPLGACRGAVLVLRGT